ncbi:MAG: four helix bundle protein [Candidatus Aureabacteria bacterium]|nr:four helix bundle protein [Candidatus Auribacterota bacterium]
MRPHKKMQIWQNVMDFIQELYSITARFPREEIYGLISQMRRAAISIASNIAEGCARKSNQEKMQFFIIARGSLSELDAQLEISRRLQFVSQEEYDTQSEKLDVISRMLQGLIDSQKQVTRSANRSIT